MYRSNENRTWAKPILLILIKLHLRRVTRSVPGLRFSLPSDWRRQQLHLLVISRKLVSPGQMHAGKRRWVWSRVSANTALWLVVTKLRMGSAVQTALPSLGCKIGCRSRRPFHSISVSSAVFISLARARASTARQLA